MGFLMGAYGKLMAGKLVRDLQFQLMSVTRRAQRITTEIGDKEKMYQAQERNMKQQMQSQMMFANYGAAQSLGLPVGAMMGMNNYSALAMMGTQGMMMGNYNAGFNQQAMMQYSQFQQMMQYQFTQAQTMWQNTFEMEREADLQQLKDIQDSLETEKLNLESRIKLAEQEQQAYKDMEKADQKGFVPEVTGQG